MQVLGHSGRRGHSRECIRPGTGRRPDAAGASTCPQAAGNPDGVSQRSLLPRVGAYGRAGRWSSSLGGRRAQDRRISSRAEAAAWSGQLRLGVRRVHAVSLRLEDLAVTRAFWVPVCRELEETVRGQVRMRFLYHQHA